MGGSHLWRYGVPVLDQSGGCEGRRATVLHLYLRDQPAGESEDPQQEPLLRKQARLKLQPESHDGATPTHAHLRVRPSAASVGCFLSDTKQLGRLQEVCEETGSLP